MAVDEIPPSGRDENSVSSTHVSPMICGYRRQPYNHAYSHKTCTTEQDTSFKYQLRIHWFVDTRLTIRCRWCCRHCLKNKPAHSHNCLTALVVRPGRSVHGMGRSAADTISDTRARHCAAKQWTARPSDLHTTTANPADSARNRYVPYTDGHCPHVCVCLLANFPRICDRLRVLLLIKKLIQFIFFFSSKFKNTWRAKLCRMR